MTRTILSFAALATLAAPALAETTPRQLQFSRDGIDYVATVRDEAGAQIISGREVGSGRAFTLRVSDGRVAGAYAGHRVSYHVPAPAPAPAVQTAAR